VRPVQAWSICMHLLPTEHKSRKQTKKSLLGSIKALWASIPKKQTANDPTGRWCAYRWQFQSKREQTSGKHHLQPGAEMGEKKNKLWKIIIYRKKIYGTKNFSQFFRAGISQNRNPDFISSSISLSLPLSAFNLVFCNPFWVGCATAAIQSGWGGGWSETTLYLSP
jgi:hypothetical protein